MFQFYLLVVGLEKEFLVTTGTGPVTLWLTNLLKQSLIVCGLIAQSPAITSTPSASTAMALLLPLISFGGRVTTYTASC